MADVTDILNDDEINQEQLMNYLKGKLSAQELHEVEKQMADSDFVNDAVEGLQTFSSNKKLDEYAKQLNKNLHDYINQKRQVKEKRKIKNLQWIILAVIIILLLCIFAYLIVSLDYESIKKLRSLHLLIYVY
ncbi:MAG: hypothetical protein ACR2FN_11270 [Chitinophagaceae bacterium]